MTDAEDDTSVRSDSGEVLIVTGMSGAGRSTAADALEDLGWYVVDNLPPQMLRPLLDLTALAASALPRVAVVVDVRGRDLFAELPEIMRALRRGRPVRVMFLDASDDVLVRRFEAVRRPHPLQGDGTILDGIHLERERLAAVRESADVIIDTSGFNIHQLATQVIDMFSADGAARHTVTLMSFGFKYGLPPDADLVADMRFLPNPFWNDDLRALTGEDDRGARLRARTAGCRRVPRRVHGGARAGARRATSARTRATRWSRSAAPAASTGRWRRCANWPRGCRLSQASRFESSTATSVVSERARE